ncbi:MAG: DUF86 domain-containing protein [Chloroflexota bacterium]|nr:DUF86 domain-containing protein [Chloroflexota bacterium]
MYLGDIVEAADALQAYVAGLTLDEFVGNDVLRRAVLQRLTEIGEAASRLSPKLKASTPDVPWVDIVGFRHIAVHAYFAVDWRIVWFAATRNAPELAERVGNLLDRADPEPE